MNDHSRRTAKARGILDRDSFPGRLFVMSSARDHVGVQLQVSDLNFLLLDT